GNAPEPANARASGTQSCSQSSSDGTSSTANSTLLSWSCQRVSSRSTAAMTISSKRCARDVESGESLGANGPRIPLPCRSRRTRGRTSPAGSSGPGRRPLMLGRLVGCEPRRAEGGRCHVTDLSRLGVPCRHRRRTGASLRSVSPTRRCFRSACPRTAEATLTYVYADSTAVLGPLATYAEPHSYDLCAEHSERLVAPRGWEVIRLSPDPAALRPTDDDLLALA